MSITLASSIAPAPPAGPGGKAPARAVEQDQNHPGSFSEALALSQQPAAEKSAVKAAPAAPARRQADPEKTESQDPVNPMAALLLPFESRMAAAKLPVGSAASGDRAMVRGDAASSDPLAETPLKKGAMAELPEVAAGTNTQGTPAAMLAAAEPNTQGTPAAMLAAADPNTQGTPAAMLAAADPNTQGTLADMLAAADPKSAGQAPVQAGDVEVQGGPAMAANPRAIAAPTGAAGTDLEDPSSRQGDEDSAVAGASGDARAGLALAAADAAAGTGSAWLLQPAGAALQTPAGGPVPNAQAPVATALLAPPVGSSEWSKALGQQVIHLGTGEHQVAELQLNPPGLGPLKVTLSMNDQQMQAMFVSAHSSVRAAVEAALPQLRAQLAESGISLGNTSVGAESQPQTAFADRQNGQNAPPPRETYRMADTDTAALLPGRPVTELIRSTSMRIDTYA